MMKLIKKLFKIFIAGVTAVALLSTALCFYSLTPVHVSNPDGNTDYVWTADSVWVKLTEGISVGKFDSKGYNNAEVVEVPDVLVLGSSHMEATSVMQDENTAAVLGSMLGKEYSVYNMGISGHTFFKVCQYLPDTMALYEDAPKVVIIETSTVDLSAEDVDAVLSGTVEFTQSRSTGIMGFLQKVPFIRLVYQQMDGGLLDLFLPDKSTEAIAEDSTQKGTDAESVSVDEKPYDKLFSYIGSFEKEYDTQIIIFYHPREILNEDGTISFEQSYGEEIFREYAELNGIEYINMQSAFEEMYYNEHHVPHGFSTGEIGVGHLNSYGHKAIAQTLYDAIIRMEEDGEICK